jgi:hypothetical protein
MSSRWVLDSERMYTSVVASDLKTAMTYANATNEVHIREESLDANEVLVLILVLQILARNFYFVKLLKSKLTEMRTVIL